jgi:SAM-dependent methyltransferase
LTPPDTERLTAALAAFAALPAPAGDAFVETKETELVRAERVRSYLRVRSGLADAKRVLDWGCRHGATAQLVRADLGADVELHGADFSPPQAYAAFHELAGLSYRQLTHPSRIDYDEASFDAVVAAGVLEHVANIGISLNELWRVLRVDGALLVTHLPNARSWSEWLSRRAAPERAHARRFRPRPLRERLLDHGFEVERWGYHHLPPTALPARGEGSALLRGALRGSQPLRRLENTWPLCTFSAAIWLVARKRWGF